MKPIAVLTIAAITALAACGSPEDDSAKTGASSAANSAVAAQIEARQAGFKKLGKAFKTMSDELRSGDADMEVLASAASSVPEITKGIEDWFPVGSGPESGVKTDALPAIWEQPGEFAIKVGKFKAAATALAAASKTGSVDAISAAFRTTGGTCKGCHDTFRKDD